MKDEKIIKNEHVTRDLIIQVLKQKSELKETREGFVLKAKEYRTKSYKISEEITELNTQIETLLSKIK